MVNLKIYTLAKPLISDTFSLFQCIDRNRQYLTNLAWSQTATEESTLQFIRKMQKADDEDFYLILQNGLVVCGAITLRDKGDHQEIGYWLGASHRGGGLMTKMVGLILKEARKPVNARIRTANMASRKTLLNNDFVEVDNDNEWVNYQWQS